MKYILIVLIVALVGCRKDKKIQPNNDSNTLNANEYYSHDAEGRLMICLSFDNGYGGKGSMCSYPSK